MIDEVLKFAGVTGATAAVDVGCGIGGSSRHLSEKYGCSVRGAPQTSVIDRNALRKTSVTLCSLPRRSARAHKTNPGVLTCCCPQLRGPASLSARSRPRPARAGVTLSPLQVERATALTAKAGLADKVSFQARGTAATRISCLTLLCARSVPALFCLQSAALLACLK